MFCMFFAVSFSTNREGGWLLKLTCSLLAVALCACMRFSRHLPRGNPDEPGFLCAGLHSGDLDAALYRPDLVEVQLQPVDLPELLLRLHRRRFHRPMVGVALDAVCGGCRGHWTP